ncbi:MAG TPA: radical SAM protein [Dehalococcoidia bacterium]|nr:radical SAM protein [Dehalococcoidia bacterium]
MLKRSSTSKTTTKCSHCNKESALISKSLSLCLECIRYDFEKVKPLVQEAHRKARLPFDLPPYPPQSKTGVPCHLCLNECRLSEGQKSYCGLRLAIGDKLAGATTERGNVSWYHDPLPTNCVADWVCPGGTGAGYPDFAYQPGPEYGHKNLAVFYQACSFDCLFCQNWHYRIAATKTKRISPSELAEAVDELTSCICYFGGDPSPQLPHALRASRLAITKSKGRILRICWETNGTMHPALLKQAAALSLESGGCIKFDLKTWNENLHIALCGISNKRTLENFHFLADYAKTRPVPPFLVASTLLIPGYIDQQEVSNIATFIASLDPNIPYALLAFHPDFLMTDLPTTSRQHAERCLKAAKEAGLHRVRIGNIHLLRNEYRSDWV